MACLVSLGPSPASVTQALDGYETPLFVPEGSPAASGHTTPQASAVDPAETPARNEDSEDEYFVQCDRCKAWQPVSEEVRDEYRNAAFFECAFVRKQCRHITKGKEKGKGKAESVEKVPERAWGEMDGYDILTEFAIPAGTVQDVPVWFRGRWRMACIIALERVLRSAKGSLESARA